MEQLHLQEVPDELIARLRERAETSGRSLEQQAIEALRVGLAVREVDADPEERLRARRKLLAEIGARMAAGESRPSGDTTAWIREDRDSR